MTDSSISPSDGSPPTAHSNAGRSDLDLAPFGVVVIGDLEWTARNLDIPWLGSWAPNGDESLVPEYGRLYTFAMARKIAALVTNWRLPTKQDIENLIRSVGGTDDSAAALKVGGCTRFGARFAGFREPEDNTFRRTHYQTGFWTSTPADDESAWKMFLRAEDSRIRFRPVSKEYGDSLRFVRDRTS